MAEWQDVVDITGGTYDALYVKGKTVNLDGVTINRQFGNDAMANDEDWTEDLPYIEGDVVVNIKNSIIGYTCAPLINGNPTGKLYVNIENSKIGNLGLDGNNGLGFAKDKIDSVVLTECEISQIELTDCGKEEFTITLDDSKVTYVTSAQNANLSLEGTSSIDSLDAVNSVTAASGSNVTIGTVKSAETKVIVEEGATVNVTETSVLNIGGTVLTNFSGSLERTDDATMIITKTGGAAMEYTMTEAADGSSVWTYVPKTYYVNPGFTADMNDEATKKIEGVTVFDTLADAIAKANDGDVVIADSADAVDASGLDVNKDIILGSGSYDLKGSNFTIGYKKGDGSVTIKKSSVELIGGGGAGGTGFIVSDSKEGRYDGTLIIDNSDVKADYLMNRNLTEIKNGSTLILQTGVLAYSISNDGGDADAVAIVKVDNSTIKIEATGRGTEIGHTEGMGKVILTNGATWDNGAERAFSVKENGSIEIIDSTLIEGTKIDNAGIISVAGTSTITAGTVTGSGQVLVGGQWAESGKPLAALENAKDTVLVWNVAKFSGSLYLGNDEDAEHTHTLKIGDESEKQSFAVDGTLLTRGNSVVEIVNAEVTRNGGYMLIQGKMSLVDSAVNITGGEFYLYNANEDTVPGKAELSLDNSTFVFDYNNIQLNTNAPAGWSLNTAEIVLNNNSTLESKNGIIVGENSTISVVDSTLKAAGKLENSGTVTVSGESSLNIGSFSGNAITLTDGAVLKDSTVIGGAWDGNPIAVSGTATLAGNNYIENLQIIADAGDKLIINGTLTSAKPTLQICAEKDGAVELNGALSGVNTSVYVADGGKLVASSTSSINITSDNGLSVEGFAELNGALAAGADLSALAEEAQFCFPGINLYEGGDLIVDNAYLKSSNLYQHGGSLNVSDSRFETVTRAEITGGTFTAANSYIKHITSETPDFRVLDGAVFNLQDSTLEVSALTNLGTVNVSGESTVNIGGSYFYEGDNYINLLAGASLVNSQAANGEFFYHGNVAIKDSTLGYVTGYVTEGSELDLVVENSIVGDLVGGEWFESATGKSLSVALDKVTIEGTLAPLHSTKISGDVNVILKDSSVEQFTVIGGSSIGGNYNVTLDNTEIGYFAMGQVTVAGDFNLTVMNGSFDTLDNSYGAGIANRLIYNIDGETFVGSISGADEIIIKAGSSVTLGTVTIAADDKLVLEDFAQTVTLTGGINNAGTITVDMSEAENYQYTLFAYTGNGSEIDYGKINIDGYYAKMVVDNDLLAVSTATVLIGGDLAYGGNTFYTGVNAFDTLEAADALTYGERTFIYTAEGTGNLTVTINGESGTTKFTIGGNSYSVAAGASKTFNLAVTANEAYSFAFASGNYMINTKLVDAHSAAGEDIVWDANNQFSDQDIDVNLGLGKKLYNFSVAKNNVGTLTAEFDSNSTVRFQILDSAGNVVESGNTVNGTYVFALEGGAEGASYQLAIYSNRDEVSTYSLNLTMKETGPSTDSTDTNKLVSALDDTWNAKEVLELTDGRVENWVGAADNVDWIDLGDIDGKHKLTMDANGSRVTATVWKEKDGAISKFASFTVTDVTSKTFNYADGYEYYLQINARNSATASTDYTVSLA